MLGSLDRKELSTTVEAYLCEGVITQLGFLAFPGAAQSLDTDHITSCKLWTSIADFLI